LAVQSFENPTKKTGHKDNHTICAKSIAKGSSKLCFMEDIKSFHEPFPSLKLLVLSFFFPAVLNNPID
jgi:hypothetical protein